MVFLNYSHTTNKSNVSFEQVLRNYRKEIQKIYVLSPNSAEDERDLRITVTIR